jgi:hypothetical protein
MTDAKGKFVKNPQTEADVNLLLKVFPDLLPDGRIVTHEQIESVLKMSRVSSRYRTVVNKWRKLVFTERRVYLDGQTAEGKGFTSLTPDEMVRFANRQVRTAGRKVKKALAVASAPNDNELSADVLKYRGLLEGAILKIAHEHQQSLREVSKSLGPAKQLPRKAG